MLALAKFYLDHRSRIEDIEINPLMVRPQGKGAVAVDVRVIGKARRSCVGWGRGQNRVRAVP